MAWEVQEAMIEVVNRIPEKKVTNYGEIAKVVARMLWRPITARVVWWMLSWLPEWEREKLPWRRVVNKKWFVSSLKLWDKWYRQIEALENEGIIVTEGFIDMKEYGIDSSELSFSW